MGTYLQKLRMINRDARLAILAMTAFGFTFYGLLAVVLNLYLLRLGYGPAFVGQFLGFGWLTYAATALLAGVMGRRWGSRRMMILGLGLHSLFLALIPLAANVRPSWQSAYLVVTYGLSLFFLATFLVNNIPYLMSVTAAEERTHAFSVRGALQPLGGVAGGARV